MIRRTPAGWRVEGSFPSLPTDTVDELGHALALADLLADSPAPGPRPPRTAEGLDELSRLRASVRQLEHALASRVVVEQAIGVLTERWRVAPRDAFEQLRRVTRSRGVRIHDLAREVIDSCTDPDVPLPAELVPTQRVAGVPPEPRQSPDRRTRADSPRQDRPEPAERSDRRERRGRRERSEGRRGGAARQGPEPPGEGPGPPARPNGQPGRPGEAVFPGAPKPVARPAQAHERHARVER